jgi:hypothetical protein
MFVILILCNSKDVCVHLNLSTIQKCTTTLKMLAYGIAINATNKQCHWVKSITTKCLKHFVKAIQKSFEEIFEGQYLWQPSKVNFET